MPCPCKMPKKYDRIIEVKERDPNTLRTKPDGASIKMKKTIAIKQVGVQTHPGFVGALFENPRLTQAGFVKSDALMKHRR